MPYVASLANEWRKRRFWRFESSQVRFAIFLLSYIMVLLSCVFPCLFWFLFLYPCPFLSLAFLLLFFLIVFVFGFYFTLCLSLLLFCLVSFSAFGLYDLVSSFFFSLVFIVSCLSLAVYLSLLINFTIPISPACLVEVPIAVNQNPSSQCQLLLFLVLNSVSFFLHPVEIRPFQG